MVEDLWFSPGMKHTDLVSDEEVEDSDEEEDSHQENALCPQDILGWLKVL